MHDLSGATRTRSAGPRGVKLRIGLLALALVVLVGASHGQQVHAVGPIGFTVGDMNRSVDFFTRVLAFEVVSDTEVWGEPYERLQGVFGLRMRIVTLRLGGETIELTEYLAPAGRPYPPDTRGNDEWFQHVAIVVSDMDSAYARLRSFGVSHVSSGPQRIPEWNLNAAGTRAFYFRDPEGHFLELIWFPEGKGDPRWQAHSGHLFLGIDHTAIVVGSTEESLKLYRDALGLRVAGQSENYGPEQEHLNGVFGSRVRITGLRAPAGPGIEFLEYLAPTGGRTAPVDLKANDLAHWQTKLIVTSMDSTWAALQRTPAAFVSPGPIALPDSRLGMTGGLLLLDPDGHGLLLVDSAAGQSGAIRSPSTKR